MAPPTPGRTGPGVVLDHLAHLVVLLEPALVVGDVPAGTRRVIPITGGRVEGQVLRGNVLPGADWNLRLPDGSGELSARYALRLEDGTVLGVTNEARVPARDERPAILTAARLEAPTDSALAWLNWTPLVGTLTVATGSVVVDLWRPTFPDRRRPLG